MKLYDYFKKRIEEISNSAYISTASMYTEDSLTKIIVKFCEKTHRNADFDNPVSDYSWNQDTQGWDDTISIPWICNIQNLKTKEGRKNAESKGMYIHMINVDVTNFKTFINNFMLIDGEVCVSEIGDEQYKPPSFSGIALVLEGKPNASFSTDCWSRQKAGGMRVWGGDEGNANRSESWMIPADCKLSGIVHGPGFQKTANSLCDYFGCDYVFDFNAINENIVV